jgi:hypothetical protein
MRSFRSLVGFGLVVAVFVCSGCTTAESSTSGAESTHLLSLPGLQLQVPRSWHLLGFGGLGVNFISSMDLANPCVSTDTRLECATYPPLTGTEFVVTVSVPQRAPIPDATAPAFPLAGTPWTIDGHEARWLRSPASTTPAATVAIRWGSVQWLKVVLVISPDAEPSEAASLIGTFRKAMSSLRFLAESPPDNFQPPGPALG